MIARPPLPAGPFLVVGLARSGVAAARTLRSRGELVVGCDAGTVAPEVRAELEALGIEIHAPADGVDLVAEAGAVVKSPGVPGGAAVVRAARAAGLAVLGELELAWRLLPNEFVAVTGSNGKTTTVELIGHVHREAGLPVAVAGNVGTALSGLVGTLGAATTVVAEASSFQLEDTLRFAPEAAVLLNLAEDHLDRHGTLEAYRAAKLEVFARQPEAAVAVAPLHPEFAELGGRARRVRFGAQPGAELLLRAGRILWEGEPLMAVSEVRLRGAHNLENAMAAAAVCLARELPRDAVRAGLATFGGVPHRLEEVGSIDGVLYVNDSKATNVASAAVGLASFPRGVHVILGGRGKGADLAPLAAAAREGVVAAYLIGETAPALRAALEPTGVALHESGDLERAVRTARAAARPGETVLLSPAMASFDQYPDFEARGEHFRTLVRALGASGERDPEGR